MRPPRDKLASSASERRWMELYTCAGCHVVLVLASLSPDARTTCIVATRNPEDSMHFRSNSSESVLASILADESFWPSEPTSLAETGLPVSVIESLAIKRLAVVGTASGRQLAGHLCLPFQLFDSLLRSLRERQIIVHNGSAPFNDYVYMLTESGRDRAAAAVKACAYAGPAPVPLEDYVLSAEAQTIRAEAPQRDELLDAFEDISVNEAMFDSLGPAINSGAGLFLYGEPGNGKSTLARRITRCFGQLVWIPRTLIEDGVIVKLYDPSLHRPAPADDDAELSSSSFDRRWIKISRPTVVVGGELTMDALEIRHDPISNVSEAPLQMKSNGGCFLIDDFGRQRIEPTELLNRWIVPLETRHDFLTLSTGKKIQVPFEQLIIFSTNLEPSDLVDEAFLRRIPYKVHVSDPSPDEFHELFEIYARDYCCTYRPDVVDQLVQKHYLGANRPMRRCHPRDLLSQIRNFCAYNDLPLEMRDEYFDRVVKSYFAVVVNAHGQSNEFLVPDSQTTDGGMELDASDPPAREPDPNSIPPPEPPTTDSASAGQNRRAQPQGIGNPIERHATDSIPSAPECVPAVDAKTTSRQPTVIRSSGAQPQAPPGAQPPVERGSSSPASGASQVAPRRAAPRAARQQPKNKALPDGNLSQGGASPQPSTQRGTSTPALTADPRRASTGGSDHRKIPSPAAQRSAAQRPAAQRPAAQRPAAQRPAAQRSGARESEAPRIMPSNHASAAVSGSQGGQGTPGSTPGPTPNRESKGSASAPDASRP